MKLNKKLIKQLAAGKIILHNEPKNPEAVKEILKEAFPDGTFPPDTGNSEYYKRGTFSTCDWRTCNGADDLPKFPISDFLLPEPKFKVGDKVLISGKSKQIITEIKWSEHFKSGQGGWCYIMGALNGIGYGESLLEAVEPAANGETENKFEIGKEYEIKYNTIDQEWIKGKLLAIVDHKHKYVVTTEDIPYPTGCAIIRPIQPKEITRWINMSQSGNQVGKKCFESEMEACQHAPMSQKVFQVKLTGTYTI